MWVWQVYIGAPNIREYTPGPKSYIDIRDFPDPKDLVAKLRELDADDDAYQVRVRVCRLGSMVGNVHCHCHSTKNKAPTTRYTNFVVPSVTRMAPAVVVRLRVVCFVLSIAGILCHVCVVYLYVVPDAGRAG